MYELYYNRLGNYSNAKVNFRFIDLLARSISFFRSNIRLQLCLSVGRLKMIRKGIIELMASVLRTREEPFVPLYVAAGAGKGGEVMKMNGIINMYNDCCDQL